MTGLSGLRQDDQRLHESLDALNGLDTLDTALVAAPSTRRWPTADQTAADGYGDTLIPGPLLIGTTPSGPLFAGRRAVFRRFRPETLVRLLQRRERITIAVLTLVWAACLVDFWFWLLQPAHRASVVGLVLNGTLLLYLSVLPLYFLLAANHMWGVNPALPIPRLRVAFAVTKARSDRWPGARKTLEAMLNQRFPYQYHVWLCDEDPSVEVLTWCQDAGVGVSSRKGADGYHNDDWPRRTRCKEGNLAYFYDRVGYHDYDVVSQLDCDHVPAARYLAEIVRPFSDPSIGYVAAPSICDSNAARSWSASGRLYYEAGFHGALQMGHHGLAPVCIGSHYAVRTRALHEIGGVGPELAEDFSTSFLMTSAGWHGAFAHRAEAHGEGPLTLAAMVKQEFQWSRSLVTVLLDTVPHHVRRLPWRLRFRFLFVLLYYPLMSSLSAAGICLPAIAAVTGVAWLHVNYLEFMAHWMSLGLCVFAVHFCLRYRGYLRPKDPPLVSWKTWMYVLARWPYILRGSVAALAQKVSPRTVRFAVTPKTRDGFERLPVSTVAPYLLIALSTSGCAVYGETHTAAVGYVFLCIASSVSYTVLSIAVCLLHAHEARFSPDTPFSTLVRRTVTAPLTFALILLVPLLLAVALYPPYFFEVYHW